MTRQELRDRVHFCENEERVCDPCLEDIKTFERAAMAKAIRWAAKQADETADYGRPHINPNELMRIADRVERGVPMTKQVDIEELRRSRDAYEDAREELLSELSQARSFQAEVHRLVARGDGCSNTDKGTQDCAISGILNLKEALAEAENDRDAFDSDRIKAVEELSQARETIRRLRETNEYLRLRWLVDEGHGGNYCASCYKRWDYGTGERHLPGCFAAPDEGESDG